MRGGKRIGSGRPRLGRKVVFLQVKCSPEEKALWTAQAESLGVSLSSFVRRSLCNNCLPKKPN